MPEALVKLDNITVALDERVVLRDISLQLRPGEIITLIGPNGAGKTTLVRAVLGLIQPTQGSVSRRRGMRIGYMPQKMHIDQQLPITVDYFLQLANRDRRAVVAALDEVDVRHVLNTPLQRISGGELQRVMLARALLRNPQLLVLDEPVQGVDVAGQTALYQLIHAIRDRRGCGVLMVSHDLHIVMSGTDTVVCLNQHICCYGHPEQVSNDPAFLSLFNRHEAANLAVYHHHHDHSHDLHGDIVDEQH